MHKAVNVTLGLPIVRTSVAHGTAFEIAGKGTADCTSLTRAVEVAKLMNDAGLICIAAFVAPNEDVRQRAVAEIGAQRTLVVHVTAPIDVCRERDQAGRYAQADRGEIANFPGVSAAYEAPAAPDLVLATDSMTVAECVTALINLLEQRGFI